MKEEHENVDDVQSHILCLEKKLQELRERKMIEDEKKQKYTPIIDMLNQENIDPQDFAQYLIREAELKKKESSKVTVEIQ